MAAGVVDFYIEQGATFSRTLTLTGPAPDLTPINLTGYTARGKIKASATDTVSIVDFTFSITPLTGVIVMSLTSVQTAAIPTTGAKYSNLTKYYYDVEIVNGDEVTRILNGTVTTSPEITK